MNGLFNIVFTLYLSFVNVYLYEYTRSFMIMSLFGICRVAVYPFIFRLANIISRKMNYASIMGVGIIFIISAMGFAVTQSELFIVNSYYTLIVSFIAGIGFGLYWYASNTSMQVIPTEDSRANFLTHYYTLNSISTLVAPFFSDIIISLSPNDLQGYRNILIFIIFVSVLVLFVASKLNVKPEEKNYSLLKCLKLDEPIYRNTMLGIFFYSVKDSLTISLTAILVANAAGSGNLYSRLLIVFSLICIYLSRFLNSLCRKDRINKSLVITSVINILSTMILVIFPNMFGAIFFGVTNAVVTSLYQGIVNFLIGQSIQRYKDDISGRVTAKETYTTLGRSVGLCFVILCYFILPENIYLIVSCVIISLAPIMVIYHFKNVIKQLEKEKGDNSF